MAWFDSKHTDGRCLPLEGGTVKGELRLEKGCIVHEIPYGSPVDGYFHVCRITVKDNYCDSPICIDYMMRGNCPVRIVLAFTGRENIGDETVKEVHQEEIPGEYTRGLRYEEFIPDMARFEQILYYMYQGQQKRIESLEEQLKEALNRIEILEGTRN